MSSQVAGGRFIDPDEHPPTILAELKQVRRRRHAGTDSYTAVKADTDS